MVKLFDFLYFKSWFWEVLQDSTVSLVSVFLWEKLLGKSVLLFVHHLVDVLTTCLKLLLGFFETLRDR